MTAIHAGLLKPSAPVKACAVLGRCFDLPPPKPSHRASFMLLCSAHSTSPASRCHHISTEALHSQGSSERQISSCSQGPASLSNTQDTEKRISSIRRVTGKAKVDKLETGCAKGVGDKNKASRGLFLKQGIWQGTCERLSFEVSSPTQALNISWAQMPHVPVPNSRSMPPVLLHLTCPLKW